MKNVLLAGATGYLGGYIAKELRRRGHHCRAIVRNPQALDRKQVEVDEVIQAEVTIPKSIAGCCEGMDVVISTVGITRQKDGLTYMDVDYQANMNLLEEARRSGVKKFVYVSVLNGNKLRHLKICDAKERFVDELKGSGLDVCVVRPNGFFSDVAEFFDMANKGRIYLLGHGKLTSNPIHGEDLAKVCVDAIDECDGELEVGGPQVLSQNEIAMMAFEVLGREPKITYIPQWVANLTLKVARTFAGIRIYGPIEFFLTVMSMEMLAPKYGNHSLRAYFSALRDAESSVAVFQNGKEE